jgi:hypothetical protein
LTSHGHIHIQESKEEAPAIAPIHEIDETRIDSVRPMRRSHSCTPGHRSSSRSSVSSTRSKSLTRSSTTHGHIHRANSSSIKSHVTFQANLPTRRTNSSHLFVIQPEQYTATHPDIEKISEEETTETVAMDSSHESSRKENRSRSSISSRSSTRHRSASRSRGNKTDDDYHHKHKKKSKKDKSHKSTKSKKRNKVVPITDDMLNKNSGDKYQQNQQHQQNDVVSEDAQVKMPKQDYANILEHAQLSLMLVQKGPSNSPPSDASRKQSKIRNPFKRIASRGQPIAAVNACM